MSIIPAGNRREQVAQGPLKNQSILESALFKKYAEGASALINDPKAPKPGNDLQNAMNSGYSDIDGIAGRQDMDRNPPADAMNTEPGITPASPSQPSQPVKALPTGSMTPEEGNVTDQPTFWENLANQLSPFLQQRNLRIVGSPKLTDRNENVYDLLLGPMIDPRTRQPMELHPTTT